ncbi:hypothetical protein AXG93_1671s1000 [Marchantia polymorpha subsp. ruderalis]|uniref:CCHC-type domain-containing protein n=1 Tax=Marchantia polymorpha subsp. ruderalis TaxID=1480154 RepID=A0A176WME3_MARPO|nr:hypothetical protein AXG93_1671s1000 [Marchantia polymorpha subsp. ruderalis]
MGSLRLGAGAVTQQPEPICEGRRSRYRQRRNTRHATSSTEGRGRTTRSTSAAEAEVRRRSGAEPATQCCCSQSKAATNRALQSAQAEGTQVRLAGKQRKDGACYREKKLAILGGGYHPTSARLFSSPYFAIPGDSRVFHTLLDLPTEDTARVQTVVQNFEDLFANTSTSPVRPTTLFRDPNPVRSSGGTSRGEGSGGGSPSPPDLPRGGPFFPPNPPDGGGGGGGPPYQPMANQPHPPPFTKHSYPKFKGGYYTDALEETAYAVQEGPPITPIQQAHIHWFVPKEMATTMPQRRLAPPAAAVSAPPNACFNCNDVGHFAPNCPHPRERVSRTIVAPKDPHYDIAADFYDRQAHDMFQQLIEDNNFYRKLMNSALKRVKWSRTHKLPRVYQVRTKDLGPPKIDIKIGGCTIRKVPLDSGSENNIMTEDTATALGIGRVVFRLNYVIIKPLTERGYKVLIGRPWFYGAKVRSDWHKRSLKFKDPNNKASPKVIVPWDKISRVVDEEDTEVAKPEEARPEDSA